MNHKQYLCYAWGETDWPEARIVSGQAEVEKFVDEQWAGGDEDILQCAMIDFIAHDWHDGALEWPFEIGGVRIELVNYFHGK